VNDKNVSICLKSKSVNEEMYGVQKETVIMGRLDIENDEGIPWQARTGRGIHGLPRVSYGPAMPYPYMPCGRAAAAVFFPLGYPFPYGSVSWYSR
jgi:hypothetical protein